MIQQSIFIVLVGLIFFFATKRFLFLRSNILQGRDIEISGNRSQRWKNVLLIAFGQKKMFSRPIPGFLHLFIYVAFIFTQIELIEILLDGAFGFHRFFVDKIGGLYNIIINFIEILSLLAFIATIVFLARRNLLKLPRFKMSEMKGWPSMDANNILFAEIVLIVGIFTMNGCDVLLQGLEPEHFKETGTLLISDNIGPAIFGGFSVNSLYILERFGWWLHLMVVLGFILYLPYSKHLHIFLSFPNVYFSKLSSIGKIENMPAIMNEVKSMYGIEVDATGAAEPDMNFGANDVTGLTWKHLLDAYSCTECGRCSNVCPASITGKLLSPRKIMMDVRDRAEELGKARSVAKDPLFYDGKSLFDRISREEIHACTTCNACVEACPILINPLDIILELRRYELLTESAGPPDWLSMFNSIENTGAVWQMPVSRDNWIHES